MVDSILLYSLFEKLKSKGSMVVFAESLTGGLISSEFSKIPGASAVLWGGFVVYNPYAKLKVLGVSETIIKTCGVISTECAEEMAKGALKASYIMGKASPSYSLAVTGVAGPAKTSGLLEVGTVCIAVAKINKLVHANLSSFPVFDISYSSNIFYFDGDRNSIREQTLNKGVEFLIKIV